MQNNTYLLRDILTAPEQFTILRLLNAIALWAGNDACSSLLLSACQNLLSGSATQKDLSAARTCLLLWQEMNSKLPEAKQNQTLSSRLTRIADKLTRLSTTPPLEYSHKRKKPGVVAG